MDKLQIAQEKTDSTLSKMMNEIQEIQKSQEYLGSKYEGIKDELKTMQNINKNLEHENAILKQTVASLQRQSAETEAKVNNLEQYSRRCCIEIQGITYKDSENTEEVVYLVKQLGINITGSEISVTQRLAPPNDSNKNPAIIVKFLSQKLRHTIYHKRWNLKDINNKTGNDGFKVFINESLTKANKDVDKAALSLKKRFHYKFVWRNHGFTYLKKDEGHHATIIRRFEDLPLDGKGLKHRVTQKDAYPYFVR